MNIMQETVKKKKKQEKSDADVVSLTPYLPGIIEVKENGKDTDGKTNTLFPISELEMDPGIRMLRVRRRPAL